MNTVNALDDLVEFLQLNVANKSKLQKDSSNDIYSYELVSPNVFKGWLPPNGYLPQGFTGIPAIIAGLDGGSDDGDSDDEQVKLSFAVYSPGTHLEDGTYTPDFNGYNDLLNLIELTKAELIKSSINISEKFKLSEEITWGMYEEQPYPYWYGYMTFSIHGKAYPRRNIEQLLNQ